MSVSDAWTSNTQGTVTFYGVTTDGTTWVAVGTGEPMVVGYVMRAEVI